jgi:hypothetical protein
MVFSNLDLPIVRVVILPPLIHTAKFAAKFSVGFQFFRVGDHALQNFDQAFNGPNTRHLSIFADPAVTSRYSNIPISVTPNFYRD